jgi:anti-sigma regulatory factor (Ser/Thr protein kinase)
MFTLTHQYACDPAVVADARGWCRRQLSQLLPVAPATDNLVDCAELIVSELLTNAVRADCRELALTLSGDADRLQVSVYDDASGEPTIVQAGPEDVHGRGLTIVAAMATAWGVRPTALGKEVWATLPTRPG